MRSLYPIFSFGRQATSSEYRYGFNSLFREEGFGGQEKATQNQEQRIVELEKQVASKKTTKP